MTVNQKISALRAIMERDGLDAYIVSGTDPHNSEYLPAAWKQREWISGFTGSFGTVVVTREHAGLWTDTRYFIQAQKQLAGTEIQMHKLRVPGAIDYPEWLAGHLAEGAKVGFDDFCMTVSQVKDLRHLLSAKNIKMIEKNAIIGEIWLDRPALPETPLFLLDAQIAGRSAAEKIVSVRQHLQHHQVDYILFSCLDEIAWLYNIRCHDIPYNPVAISYAVISRNRAYLFIKEVKVLSEVKQSLYHGGIEILDYHHLLLFLNEQDKSSCFWLDANTINYAIYESVKERFHLFTKPSPIILEKAIKNQKEVDGFREAYLKDGVALTKFFYWLTHNIGSSEELSEVTVADQLTELRAENSDYISDSFHPISAYGENAALPHYTAVRDNDSILKAKGLYLIDSGAQYVHGTTDITRTIALGELSGLEKEDYTLVLKGMIALSKLTFPKGTKGCNLDIIARQYLWQKLRNYGHGTGHGVGFFLNVHEGPQAIRQELKDQEILPGMVTSNEPGMYREGSHGVRHENMIVCKHIASNEFGEWYGFETLTLCYFDTTALLPELLDQEEKSWLNNYHRTVYDKISPFLTLEEAKWLKTKTSPL